MKRGASSRDVASLLTLPNLTPGQNVYVRFNALFPQEHVRTVITTARRPSSGGPVNKGDCFRRKSLESEGGHTWREYTYRKITPCDACGQVLRGHSRQGVRCRGCKANAHTDCINMVQPALCPSLAPKKGGGIPLLRRQKTQVPADEVPASSEHSEYESRYPRTRSTTFSSLPPPSPPPSPTALSLSRTLCR